MKEPLLACCSLPPSDGYKVRRTMRVEGGLHHIKGNRTPYFSLTCEVFRTGHPNQCWSGGCDHELILKKFPKFKDLADLHLCTIDGVPMHEGANGWYMLAGALPENGCQEYHVGNSKRHFPKAVIDPKSPWSTTDYRCPTPDECLAIFAEHMRFSVEEAVKIRDAVVQVYEKEMDRLRIESCDLIPVATRDAWKVAKRVLDDCIQQQLPRWKEEAEACIKKHNLRIYGDPWPVQEEEVA